MRPVFTQPAKAGPSSGATLPLRVPEAFAPTMPVTLTAAAADRARQFIAQQPGGVGLRFGVRKNGCSGFAYVVDVASEAAADDQVFEQHGVQVLVDARSLPHVEGTEIDFVSRGLNREFVFRNPQSTGECGCGESFTTRDDLPA